MSANLIWIYESAYGVELLPFAVSRMAALTVPSLEDLARWEAEPSAASQRLEMGNGRRTGRASANSVFTGVFDMINGAPVKRVLTYHVSSHRGEPHVH